MVCFLAVLVALYALNIPQNGRTNYSVRNYEIHIAVKNTVL